MILPPETEHKEIPVNSLSMVMGLGYKMNKADNRYQAYYRYLQSKWRDSKEIPVRKIGGGSVSQSVSEVSSLKFVGLR